MKYVYIVETRISAREWIRSGNVPHDYPSKNAAIEALKRDAAPKSPYRVVEVPSRHFGKIVCKFNNGKVTR